MYCTNSYRCGPVNHQPVSIGNIGPRQQFSGAVNMYHKVINPMHVIICNRYAYQTLCKAW